VSSHSVVDIEAAGIEVAHVDAITSRQEVLTPSITGIEVQFARHASFPCILSPATTGDIRVKE